MKHAIIDIGSNSMRLSLYEVNEGNFKVLFREKYMAGLAGYVDKDGNLSLDGIECAINGLLEFKAALESLNIADVSVFATASLRNINNTAEAVRLIHAASGYEIEVISGEEEALLGYSGAMQELSITDGAFMDVGGASTEIVTFDAGEPIHFASFEVGSLKLYQEYVKKILPGEGALKKMCKAITGGIEKKDVMPFDERRQLVCVGGSARAVLKLGKKYYHLPDDTNTLSSKQLNDLATLLYSGEKEATDLILKLTSDRVHTIVPGIMILQHVMNLFKAEEIIISKYGVREGYLWQKIMKKTKNNTITPKIEN